jgi:scyllo-inositol 2-dehydrogenase (NADP+)
MPDELRVAVVGYGLGGAAFHAPLVASTRGLRLTHVVTRDAERRRQAAQAYPGVHLVDRADDLWAHAAELDLVVVTTPNRLHVPVARAAIERGLGVVVDKPFAVSAREGRELVELARARRTMLTVYQNRRWDGDFLTLQRLLREGALGWPRRLESRFERWRPQPKGDWRERADPEEAGGILFDLGSHLIDQALVLFGPVRAVYAELDVRRDGVAADDDAFVALEHDGGVRSHLHMSAVAAVPNPRFRLLGSGGAFVKYGLDVQEDALRRGERPGRPEWGEEPRDQWGTLSDGTQSRAVPSERGDYGAFYSAVAAAMRGEGPPPVDPSDSVAGLRIIEAARRSAAERRVVSLEAGFA